MPRANSLFPIGVSVVKVLARLAARNEVKRQLRAQGVRVSPVRHAEILAQASAYLADHPELYQEALERAQREGLIEQQRCLAYDDSESAGLTNQSFGASAQDCARASI